MLDKEVLGRIKEYNTALRAYNEKSAQARAEYDYSIKELTRLCKELSVELGVEVTPENLEQVYNACMTKIENQLKSGEEILARIKREEAGVSEEKDGEEGFSEIPNKPVELPKLF